MHRRRRLLGTIVTMLLAIAAVSAGAVMAGSEAVYDDALHWDNWSWGTTVDTNTTAHVREGSNSMAVTYNDAWAGLQLHHDGLDTSPYTRLEFALHADGNSFPEITAALYDSSGSSLRRVEVAPYASADGDWYEVTIPLADLNAEGTTVTRLLLQDRSGGAQPTFYIDSLQFASDEDEGVTFTVTTTAADDDANPGDGVCETAAGECSLQGAVQEIRALFDGGPGDATVTVPAGTYVPDSHMTAEGAAVSYRLLIDESAHVRLFGDGVGQTVIQSTGEWDPRALFLVEEGATLEMSGITLQGTTDPAQAIVNSGQLELTDSEITGTSIRALSNFGSAVLTNVSVNNNEGGIEIVTGSVHLKGSEVRDNSSSDDGGGIVVVESDFHEPGSLIVEDSIIADNNAAGDGGGIFNEVGTVSLRNASVINNGPNDCNDFVDEADAASTDSDGTCIPPVDAVFIYDNWTHWDNWSWSTSIDRGDTDPVYGGGHSMRVTYHSAWAGLSFHDDGFDTSDFDDLRFAIHTDGNPFPNVRLKVHGADGSQVGKVDPRNYQSDAGDGWVLVSIPLADLGAANTTITRVTLQEASGSPQPSFNIDGYGFFMADEGLTFNVTTTAAEDDANPGDGACETASGECSLQGAVQEANELSDNVTIQVPAGTYEPNAGMTPEGEECQIGYGAKENCYRIAIWAYGSVRIVGDGASTTIIDTGRFPGVRVDEGAHLEFEGLTLRGVNVSNGSGAAFENYGDAMLKEMTVADNTNGEAGSGHGPAGIFNIGNLTLQSSTLTNNRADYGGAIQNEGSMEIYDSSVTGTRSLNAAVQNRGTLRIERSDISSNEGATTGGVSSQTMTTIVDSTITNNIGGVAGGLAGSFRLEGTTVSGNTLEGGGEATAGGIQPGEVVLIDSHIINNTPQDCSKFVTEADAASSDSDGTCIPDEEPLTHFIYDNWMHWDNWSWSTSIDRGDTDPVYGGEHSMLVTYNGAWAGLSFHDDGFDTTDFSTIRLAIHTGGNPFPNVRLKVHGADGSEIGKVDPRDYDSDAGDGWLLVTVPLADLNAEDTTITRVTIQEASGSPPPSFNIDGYGFWGE